MEKTTSVKETRQIIKDWKKQGLSIGFVPTMGFLHEGHQSLIQRSVSENDRAVVSIFVNPMQFGPTEDLATYPRDKARDLFICESCDADLVFLPETSELYPAGFCTFADMTVLTTELCGKTRPNHFRGVCTIVNKLFNIITPDRAYFGRKDAQQLAVITRMALDFNTDIEIIGCEIIRESDGLAKSSRNNYLSPDERKAACVLSRSLQAGRVLLESGEKDPRVLIAAIKDIISNEPLASIDYVEIVKADSIQKVDRIEDPVLVAIAVYIGKTRLIDNFVFHV
ncbi:MAG: pantoate--beta-alanine ligase [Eubacteriales bacterium]|nr:pantoate--beta-alanine ligase [Eubacteriales bacterium]